MKKIISLVLLMLVCLVVMIAPSFGAESSQADEGLQALEGTRYILKKGAKIPGVSLVKELFADQAMLDLEGIKDPTFGSADETIELLTAFSIEERNDQKLLSRLLDQ